MNAKLITEEPTNEEDLTTKESSKKTYKWEIVWTNVIFLGLLHIAAVYSISLRSKALWSTVIIGKTFAIVSTLGITGGAHRLWSHKSYKANNIVQLIWIFLASCTYENSIYIWSRDHRVHHKYSETDADPHNAKRGFFFCHVGWLLVRKHPDVIEKGKTIDMSDLEANPIVMFQHRYYYPIVFLGTVVFPMVLSNAFGESLYNSFFLVVIYRYIVSTNLVWCINSLAHLYGNKPYNTRIGPTENIVMRFVGLGEGFHNYHHTFPWDYKAGEYTGDVKNVTASIIDLFAKIGWVTDRKTAPRKIINEQMNKLGDTTMISPPKGWMRLKDFLIFSAFIVAL